MTKKLVAVVDVGSSDIVTYAVEKTQDNFSIKSVASAGYPGFRNGVLTDERALGVAVSECITRLRIDTGAIFRRVCVGVPAEFACVRTKEIRTDFGKEQKIDERLISQLLNAEDEFTGIGGFETLNSSVITASVDDEKLVTNPIGLTAQTLTVTASYCLVEQQFRRTLTGILKGQGIPQIDFIATPYAEAMALFSAQERERTVLFADIGYRSSNMALVRGGGLLGLASFSLGKEHMINAVLLGLQHAYKRELLETEHVEFMLRQLNLNVRPAQDKLVVASQEVMIYENEAADVVSAGIEDIAHMLKRCIEGFRPYRVGSYMPLYITGVGILSIRGAKSVLERSMGRKVEGLAPMVPNFDSPADSAGIGLIEEAMRTERAKRGLLSYLFCTKPPSRRGQC